MPASGLYVVIGEYTGQTNPEVEVKMNITYNNPGEDFDHQTLLDKGQFYEAVLPLPTCFPSSGCRSIVKPVDTADHNLAFNLHDKFAVHLTVRDIFNRFLSWSTCCLFE